MRGRDTGQTVDGQAKTMLGQARRRVRSQDVGRQVRRTAQQRTGTCFMGLVRFNMAHRINTFFRVPVAYRHRRRVAMIHIAATVQDNGVIGAAIHA